MDEGFSSVSKSDLSFMLTDYFVQAAAVKHKKSEVVFWAFVFTGRLKPPQGELEKQVSFITQD